MQNAINNLIKKSTNPTFIGEVFDFAQKTYKDTQRSTKETYLAHVTRVAAILQSMGVDEITVAAGILHDAANPTVSPSREKVLQEIEKKFGKDISTLVERNTELHKIYYSFIVNRKAENFLHTQKAESIRKMFLAIAKDIRVILIELAARIDGLKEITTLSAETQKLYATETLEIFVPLANRLGLGDIKRKLEDPAFAILFPEKFLWLQSQLKEKYEERERYLKKFIPRLKKVLQHERIQFIDVHSRAKSYWSTYQKLERHQMDFEKLHDLVAIRLIVKDVATCYKALGILHKHFPPMSGQIQDYIAKPKDNGYQSLHTTLFTDKEKLSEIQIKTEEMHQEAEHGICAHWAYKEKGHAKQDEEMLSWSKKLPELLKTFKIDFFENQIFTFTPKGDVIVLPKHATPVDFAYAVHSDVGNHCESAKINGAIIPLSQELKNGDIIEIITNKKRKPSYDWLKFVKTGLARSNIKKLTAAIINPIFSVPAYIGKKIGDISDTSKKILEKVKPAKQKQQEIFIGGQKNIAVTMAKCCMPAHGDKVIAYLTKHRAAVLHKDSCENMQKLLKHSPEKIMSAAWHQS